MKWTNSNLLVLFSSQFKNEQAIKQEAECLHEILFDLISPENFCIAHELVNRNRITSDKKKLLKESKHFQLRAFRFFINKN